MASDPRELLELLEIKSQDFADNAGSLGHALRKSLAALRAVLDLCLADPVADAPGSLRVFVETRDIHEAITRELEKP